MTTSPSSASRRPEPANPGSSAPSELTHDARHGHGRGGRPHILTPIVVVGALALGMGVVGNRLRPATLDDILAFTVLLVAAAASAGLRFGRAGEERVTFSFTGVVLLAAIPLVGPVGAILLGVGAAVLDARQAWWQASLFNGLMFGVGAGAASLVYGGVGGAFLTQGLTAGGGRVAYTAPVLTTSVAGPLLAADAALILTNLLVLLAVTSRDPQAPSPRVVVAGALYTVPTFLAWAVVAFVVVVLWEPAGLGSIALLLVVAPLVVTRHMHALFTAERRTRSSIIGALAGAGRDDRAKAHGDRVLRYALAIATELGVRPAERAAIQYAARLHAVGMTVPCDRALRVDDGRGGRRSCAAVSAALAAYEVIGRIEFLQATAQAVRHEAEWFDGSGGPDGLGGADIPLAARILAVADAADVIATGSDADRPDVEILSVLDLYAGKRFDPAAVAALARALDIDGRSRWSARDATGSRQARGVRAGGRRRAVRR